MLFCPKCSSILMPKKEGSKTVSVCSCGYKSKEGGAGKLKENVKNKSGKVEVVDSEEDMKALPKMKIECSKCQNQEAVFWEVQTRAADEPATKFMKCTKCKHIWRDYN